MCLQGLYVRFVLKVQWRGMKWIRPGVGCDTKIPNGRDIIEFEFQIRLKQYMSDQPHKSVSNMFRFYFFCSKGRICFNHQISRHIVCMHIIIVYVIQSISARLIRCFSIAKPIQNTVRSAKKKILKGGVPQEKLVESVKFVVCYLQGLIYCWRSFNRVHFSYDSIHDLPRLTFIDFTKLRFMFFGGVF